MWLDSRSGLCASMRFKRIRKKKASLEGMRRQVQLTKPLYEFRLAGRAYKANVGDGGVVSIVPVVVLDRS